MHYETGRLDGMIQSFQVKCSFFVGKTRELEFAQHLKLALGYKALWGRIYTVRHCLPV